MRYITSTLAIVAIAFACTACAGKSSSSDQSNSTSTEATACTFVSRASFCQFARSSCRGRIRHRWLRVHRHRARGAGLYRCEVTVAFNRMLHLSHLPVEGLWCGRCAASAEEVIRLLTARQGTRNCRTSAR